MVERLVVSTTFAKKQHIERIEDLDLFDCFTQQSCSIFSNFPDKRQLATFLALHLRSHHDRETDPPPSHEARI